MPEIEDVELSPWQEPPDIGGFAEKSLFYRHCGYVIRTLKKRRMLKCEFCLNALQHRGPDKPHPLSVFPKLTNFNEKAQFELSHTVYLLLRRIEFNLRRWKPQLKSIRKMRVQNVMKHLPADMFQTPISPCHPVNNTFTSVFIVSRLKHFLALFNEN